MIYCRAVLWEKEKEGRRQFSSLLLLLLFCPALRYSIFYLRRGDAFPPFFCRPGAIRPHFRIFATEKKEAPFLRLFSFSAIITGERERENEGRKTTTRDFLAFPRTKRERKGEGGAEENNFSNFSRSAFSRTRLLLLLLLTLSETHHCPERIRERRRRRRRSRHST